MERVTRVRTILVKEDKMIFIKRVKIQNHVKEEYYTFPGGGIEEGETYEETALREIKEEIGIEARYIKPIYCTEFKKEIQLFVICKYCGGNMGTGTGPEFLEVTPYNQFIPVEVPIEEIDKLEIRPANIKCQFLQDMNQFGGIFEIPSME